MRGFIDKQRSVDRYMFVYACLRYRDRGKESEREREEREIWTHLYGGGMMKRKRKPGANLLEALIQRNNNLRQWEFHYFINIIFYLI